MKNPRKKVKKLILHEQWIEITRENGKTVSRFYPPNDEFDRLRLDMDPPPDLIYRRMHFAHGVPSEYDWTYPTPEARLCGGHCIHRIKTEDWPKITQQERLTGHVVPSPNPQPRPAQFGPCPCARCTARREAEFPVHTS